MLITDTDSRVEFAAALAHEVNRVYAESLGDYSQMNWTSTPDIIRQAVRAGVISFMASGLAHTPEQSHADWVKYKKAEGWTYSRVKDLILKTHPNLVPWSDLPLHERTKDSLFLAVVRQVFDPLYSALFRPEWDENTYLTQTNFSPFPLGDE